MSEGDATDAGEGGAEISVGSAAARLGITASTLRSWGSRYGLVGSVRTGGGHRRYSVADLEVLADARARMLAGAAPAAAAAEALARSGRAPHHLAGPDRPGGAGPGGRVLAVPGADASTRGLARSASQLDLDSTEDIVLRDLRERGVARCWEDMVRPVLVAAGKRWAESGDGIEVEHLLSEAVLGALRRRRSELPRPDGGRPVLLASAPGDLHTLTLHVLALGLAERGLPAQVLGARVPVETLATVTRRTRPRAVFVGCTVAGAVDPSALAAAMPSTRPPTAVVVGGAGWPADLPPTLRPAPDLAEALRMLAGAGRERDGSTL